MNDAVKALAERYFGKKVLSIQPLGGGFYGRVFGVDLDGSPFRVAAKVYLFSGLHRREADQLEVLAKHSLVRVPQVLCVHDADDQIPHDVMVMEFVDGINAGHVGEIDVTNRERIADQIVDNLIAWHDVVHPAGFGEINGATFADDWRAGFKVRARSNCQKAAGLLERGGIDREVLEIMLRAFDRYDAIFSAPIKSARLIHGDYNTWNVLLNHQASEVVGVIDPFNCCWADAEFDLYQLNNANGRYFGLLEKYRERVQTSENFDLKSSFYELFTEIMHFYDASIDATKSALPAQAAQLKRQMDEYGI
jgi:fructosamine-3-kinase